MGGQVVFAQISLDLDNFPDAFNPAGFVDEKLSEQLPRDDLRVTVIKTARKFLHSERLAEEAAKQEENYYRPPTT